MYDQTFDKMYGAGMLKPIAENMEDFYELTDESRYTEEMGLELEIDNGWYCFLKNYEIEWIGNERSSEYAEL